MQQQDIKKIVEETLCSFDGAKRAEAKPFLLTRIYARMQNQAGTQNAWTRIGSFLSKPAVAFGGLLLIIVLNVTVLVNGSNNNQQNSGTAKDEFAVNVISIYDFENQEP